MVPDNSAGILKFSAQPQFIPCLKIKSKSKQGRECDSFGGCLPGRNKYFAGRGRKGELPGGSLLI